MENLDIFVLALFSFLMGAALVGIAVYLRAGSKRPTSDGSHDADLDEVAHLWRSRKTNRMLVQLDNQTYNTASELSEKQHRHLEGTVSVLQSWLAEGKPAISSQPTDPVVSGVATPAAPVIRMEQQMLKPESPAQEVKPVAARPLDALNRAFTSSSKQTTAQFKSIAAQINDILQARLPGSPFEVEGIGLVEMPDQGIVVRVGTDEYPGVEAVPDPAIKAFIKAAVAEWEASTRAGIR